MAWNPKLEKLIYEAGDFLEQQTRELLDPKSWAVTTAAKIAFNNASTGKALKARMEEMGFTLPDENATPQEAINSMRALVALAEENGSNAADKIKKLIPVAELLAVELKDAGSDLAKVKAAKKLKISF